MAAAAAEEREEKTRARNSPGARLFGQAQYLKNQIHPEYKKRPRSTYTIRTWAASNGTL